MFFISSQILKIWCPNVSGVNIWLDTVEIDIYAVNAPPMLAEAAVVRFEAANNYPKKLPFQNNLELPLRKTRKHTCH